MPVIVCQRCSHNALWIDDQVISFKEANDTLEAKDFKVILSSVDGFYKQPLPGEPIECHNCHNDMLQAIQKAWHEYKIKKPGEWDL